MTGMNMNERSKALEGIRLSAGNAGKLTVGTQSVHAEPCKRDKVSVVVCGRVGYEAALGFMLGENLADVVAGNTPNRVNEAFAQISESRCGRCIRHCPLRLMPSHIVAAYEAGNMERLAELKVNLCMECGCCSFGCPAHRPLVQTNKLAKAKLAAWRKAQSEKLDAKKEAVK